MKWRIEYSRHAERFINKHNVRDEVREELKKVLLKIKGENVNIDIKKLSGEWKGYLRVRKGKLRIIFELVKRENIIFVERIDNRGEVYK